MEKKESDIADRLEQLKQLKEMSLLSLSHTPSTDLDEVIKIIKNFFGVFFGINDEFTYSELLEKAASFGLDDKSLIRVSEYIEKLQYLLYIKQNPGDVDMEFIKKGICDIIELLVPEDTSKSFEIKKSAVAQQQPLQQPKQVIEQQQVSKPVNAQQQAPKPVVVKPAFSKPQAAPDSNLQEIESQVAALEKQVSGANNPFVKLEFESLAGDISLYKADPSSIEPSSLLKRIETIKGRLGLLV